MRIAVIMAGGAGERFWPYSRRTRPKQLLALASNKSLLQEAVDRISPTIDLEHIYIVTGEELKAPILSVLTELPEANVLCEPEGKNTAPCLAFATAVAIRKYGDPAMAVLTADHVIKRTADFGRDVSLALAFAEKNPALLTLGIPPTRAETGFGYIEAGNLIESAESGKIYKVQRFTEKPDPETATQFISFGNFYWNSGMFFWRASTFVENAQQHSPALAQAIDKIKKAWGTKQQQAILQQAYQSLPTISVDYAVMEKSAQVYVVPASFDWDDAGTWLALQRIRTKDNSGNIIIGSNIQLDTKDCIIFNQPSVDAAKDKEQLIATLGVKGLIIVNTGDALLICDKAKDQEVKKIVQQLSNSGFNHLL